MRGKTITILILVTCLLLMADAGQCAESGSADSADRDGSRYDGIPIDSIVIENRNIYDTKDEAYDAFLFKLANKLHIKTRKYVVRREVLLEEGQPYNDDLAQETARNLRANLKVYDAWVEPELLQNGNLLLRVITIDEWSFTGGLNYSREGNETRYQIGVEEENFIGTNQFVSFYYFAQSDDDNFIEGKFFENRVLGKPLQLRMGYSNDPVDGEKSLSIRRPFYDLRQKLSFGINLLSTDGRRDIYNDSLKIGESMFDGDVAISSVSYRLGRYNRKLKLGLEHQYKFEKNFDRTIFYRNTEDSLLAVSSFPDDSLYHELTLKTAFSDFDYIEVTNIDGFAYTEDLIMGYFANAELGRAFEPGFDAYHYDRAQASLSRYLSIGRSLVLIDYGHVLWFNGGNVIRHYTSFSGKYFNRVSDVATLAIRGAYLSDWDADGRDNLLLGGTSGIRGYDKYFRTGERKLLFNAEARFFSRVKILSAMFGATAFVDFGSVGRASETSRFGEFYGSVGAGLRIAFEKSTRNIVRIDLAWSETNQWELSIGTDQYFFAQR